MESNLVLNFKLKALTAIWTGGVNSRDGTKLHFTGIKGSLRWWYEVLIRGFDKYACSPTQKEKDEKTKPCNFELSKDDKQRIENGKTTTAEIAKQKICPACYLFGCTGWSGKFNLRVREYKEDESGRIITEQITAETPFILEFIQRKKIEPAEEFLIKMTLKLIVDYGAIGGKTVLKPSEFAYKNPQTHAKEHHLDYGIIERYKDEKGKDESGIPTQKIYNGDDKNKVDIYLNNFSNSTADNKSEWPDLRYFWFVKGEYIKRNEHNAIGIKPEAIIVNTKTLLPTDDHIIPGVRRCFGYAQKGECDKVKALIEEKCPHLKEKIKKGTEVRDEL